MSTDQHALITAAQELVKEPREARPKVPCPYPGCGSWYSTVVMCLPADTTFVRRRKCVRCGKAFETEEIVRALPDMVKAAS